jgi:hypothetical protein
MRASIRKIKIFLKVLGFNNFYKRIVKQIKKIKQFKEFLMQIKEPYLIMQSTKAGRQLSF